jgi:hypothetical protein
MDLRAAAVLGLDAYMEAHRLDAVLFAGRPGAASRPRQTIGAFGYTCARSRRYGGMIVGYARTSITDQAAGLAAQERDLTAAGAERIFGE